MVHLLIACKCMQVSYKTGYIPHFWMKEHWMFLLVNYIWQDVYYIVQAREQTGSDDVKFCSKLLSHSLFKFNLKAVIKQFSSNKTFLYANPSTIQHSLSHSIFILVFQIPQMIPVCNSCSSSNKKYYSSLHCKTTWFQTGISEMPLFLSRLKTFLFDKTYN